MEKAIKRTNQSNYRTGKSSVINARYINPRTDFAFKLLFGKEPNKDLLIDFLNGIFRGRKVVTDLVYINPETKGPLKAYRRTAFDLYCTDQQGGRFIVEMQQVRQEFFKDRIVFYSANLIQEQGISVNADWNYELPEIYFIALMDFCFDNSHPEHHIHDVRLVEVNTNTQFYDKLNYIFIELPKFKKKANELETKADNWLFTINNLEKLTEIPLSLSKMKAFQKLYKMAEIGKLTLAEMNAYQYSLKVLRDNYSADQYAEKRGLERGIAKGMEKGMAEGLEQGLAQGLEKGRHEEALETAREMKKDGEPIAKIVKYTKLTIQEIEAL